MHAQTGNTRSDTTDDALLPRALRAFIRRRLLELTGLTLLALAGLLTLALASWSVRDPSLDRAVDGDIHNLLGWPGAVLADMMIVQLGLAAILPVAALVVWASRLLALKPLRRPHARLLWLVPAVLTAAALLAALPTPSAWVLDTGLGGNVGVALFEALRDLLALALKPFVATLLLALLLLAAAVFATLRAFGISGDGVVQAAAVLGEKRQQKLAAGVGFFGHLRLRLAALLGSRRQQRAQRHGWQAETVAMPTPQPVSQAGEAEEPAAVPVIMRPPANPEPDQDGATADRPPVAAFAPRIRQAGGSLLGRMKQAMGRMAARFGSADEHATATPAVTPAPDPAFTAPGMQQPHPAPVAPVAPMPVAPTPEQRHEPLLAPGAAMPAAATPSVTTPQAVAPVATATPAAPAMPEMAAPQPAAAAQPPSPQAYQPQPPRPPQQVPQPDASVQGAGMQQPLAAPAQPDPTAAPMEAVLPEPPVAAPTPVDATSEAPSPAVAAADNAPADATPVEDGVRIGAPMDAAFLPQELDEAGQPVEDASQPAAMPSATTQQASAPQPQAPAQAPVQAAPPRPQPQTQAQPPAAPQPQRPKQIELPSLDILAKPDPSQRQRLSDAQLQENALQLAQVLEDFGVKGQIVNVCPGPVVTLYEFRPAPGIKSSRVIGLADDIARSMCAISARIAVVPGRNVIGIELPNERRETVFLREMLESKGYRASKLNLPLALGKNIAGEPVFADLARMPHLLIAGTTGSGKSVGINTFIMSLLYKYTPEHCRLIMIDPKMLELSIYDGIPHLLTPVVTDPKKAVVALKWAVREMEERYQKMAMLQVRNIDGFNAKVREALKKGEQITRTVQTGFDPNSGEPVFEEEVLDLQPLPFIVVIIDEMADLMMVAGKEIEGAVQRLAQMARAAGIHVIMATQRPSVDVITGTIKANFPTRISFQVTSKIDSRTILGEQGAEQLLGQGDMLYMAGGGRIVRLHGPFVSDAEVEQVVTFLKKQAPPEYVEAVTSEEEEAPAAAVSEDGAVSATGDDLYDRAVQVVLRDRKVSTSYIQRRLQIGYNKAATLIERMEAEGLISAPNSKGRREVLVGGDSAQD